MQMTQRLGTAPNGLTALVLGVSLALVPLSQAQDLPADGDDRTIATWATPGMVLNPVAFTMDAQGNAYVVETYRAGNAVSDTRQLGHLNGVEEDLLLRSVEDRRALIQKWIDQGAFEPDYFTRTEDRIKLIRDTNGDGVADASSVFADGFNDAVDGIGAGVLWRDEGLYFTCIPHLWRLEDADNDGTAEGRESVSYGYGVRWCFYGHDLHGLVNGPDGRIYFSMGDRGYNVTNQEGENFFGPDRGAVFRCWPDGSGLEIFCVGLRNPQELAFDEFGNLFTGDNNCDAGDRARVVYCMEGSDSGWRQNVQSLPSRGPWNRELMWELLVDPRDYARPAWVLPPIDHVGAGPSGFAYYPGTGESFAYDDTFFMVDFYGAGTTVHSFRARAHGAGFTLTEKGEYYKGKTVTDIMWGPDSRLYLSDWGGGWQPNENGNMFTITNDTVHGDDRARALIEEVREIIQTGVADRSVDDLIAFMGHRDQRVRQNAQYELASRGDAGLDAVVTLATDTDADEVHRVHAIWCVGQIARTMPDAGEALLPLLQDRHDQVRLATTRTLGDLRQGSPDAYAALLTDASAQVRAAAGIALGKVGTVDDIPALLDALEANDDHDVYLRHGLVHGLTLLDQPDALIDLVAGRSRSARLGAVLALRALTNTGVIPFMSDPDPGVAIEAARAVYDHYMPAGMPALASKIGSELDPALAIEAYLRRAIEANVYLGTPREADRLAKFAADARVPAAWRTLALERLRDWDEPHTRDGVWGDWLDLPARPTDDARRAVLTHIDAIEASATGDLLELAEAVGAKYALELDVARAMDLLVDPERGESLRLVTLEQIAEREPGSLVEAGLAVLNATSDATTSALRVRARELLIEADATAGVDAFESALREGELTERQHAVRALSESDAPEALSLLETEAALLASGELDASIALEIFEASETLSGEAGDARNAVSGWNPDRPEGWQTGLLAAGGDAARGREVFLHHEAAQCARCHTVAGEPAAGIAGPNLTDVGERLGRAALIESLAEPNATLAAGFDNLPFSAMPVMTTILTPHEARDVVAYLASLAGEGGAVIEDAPTLVSDVVDARTLAGEPPLPPESAGKSGGRTWSGWSLVLLLPLGLYVVALVPLIAWLIARHARRGF